MAWNSDDSPKISEACKTVAQFGFPEEKVKVTLKRLVKLYDNDWKFIEEENYREVIDVLLKENPNKSKSHRNLVHQHVQGSSVVNNPNKRIKKSQSSPSQDKGKSPECLQAAASPERPQAAARERNSHFENGEVMEGKDKFGGVSNLSQFNIASSANEEVKISLICSSSGNSSFTHRSLEAALGEVKDECCRTYGIQDPHFSLVKLMEKVCEYFLQMDNGSRSETRNTIHDMSKQSVEKYLVSKDDNQGSSALHPSQLVEDPQPFRSPAMVAILQKKYPIYVEDISRGEENIMIPLVNESITLELPDFIYIRNNLVYNDARVDSSLARIPDDNCCAKCCGDCLSAALPCACAAETGGEFVYTQEGLLKEKFLDECMALCSDPKRKHFYHCEICPLQNNLKKKSRRIKPCKGHLTRKFIKECWSKCGCNKTCGNRVVQRGIQIAMQVFATPEGKGWGVRSVNALKKGTFVFEYVGEIVTNQELDERNKARAAKKEKHTYPVLLDADWGSERILEDNEALCLDATEFGNIGRFVNHRCNDANLIEIPVEVEIPDHHCYRLAFFTTRDIEPMEELTWDYGIEFNDRYHPIKAFKCHCGSMCCRGKERRR